MGPGRGIGRVAWALAPMLASACVGHRFVPPSSGAMVNDPRPGESDVSLALGVDDALTPFLELPAIVARPGPPWRLELTGRAALADTASNGRTGIGLLAARGAWERDPIALGVGLGFTLFTFVVTADVGVHETVRIGVDTRVTLGLDVYAGVPLDDSLGSDLNRWVGAIEPADVVRPGPTVGGMAGVTIGQPIAPAVEVRMAFVARAFSDLEGELEVEGLWLVGIGIASPASDAPREPRKRKRRDTSIEWTPVQGY
ncbi:MAG: hypothetical protein IT385_09270 [Deltaproteobacteria bacterium]|nr:hypothetical protein [Deltaproteobacteria bacterium]